MGISYTYSVIYKGDAIIFMNCGSGPWFILGIKKSWVFGQKISSQNLPQQYYWDIIKPKSVFRVA